MVRWMMRPYVALLIHWQEKPAWKGLQALDFFAMRDGGRERIVGCTHLMQTPSRSQRSIAANNQLGINLSPISMEILTVHALDETTAGDDAAAVAASMQIKGSRMTPDPNVT